MTQNLIMDVVARYTGITPEQMKSRKRVREFVVARQLFCYFCRKFTGLTFTEIGRCVGSRDHSTVMYSVEAIKNAMFMPKSYPEISKHYSAINQRLTAPKRVYNKYRTGTVRRWWR
jgi:chromosomal replication initiator protein